MSQNKPSNADLIEDDEQSGWLVTYADLMTLLLVFFVLMYAISSLNLAKFKKTIASFQVTLGKSKPATNILEIIKNAGQSDQKVSLEDLSGLRSRENDILDDIDDVIAEKKLSEHIIAKLSNGKIYIQIWGKILFNSGAAELNSEAKPILDKIAAIVNDYEEYDVNIKGHTDNTPISTARFASNWELSAIRATTVLKHLINGGVDPVRLTATGYGDLLPLVPNNTADNRAVNRRVEFVLEKKTN